MDYQLQVLTLAVSDVDRAKAFYADKAGFALDVDYHPAPGFRVVQFTPPGSACSIQFGIGLTDTATATATAPGKSGSVYLVVADIEAAHRELRERGVHIGAIRHKDPVATWAGGFAPGTDLQRRDYASFAEFADDDGNTWVLQEIGHRQQA